MLKRRVDRPTRARERIYLFVRDAARLHPHSAGIWLTKSRRDLHGRAWKSIDRRAA